MTMKEDGVTLIKIGGSCISDKKKPKSFFPEVIDFVSKAINDNNLNAIIIHGGGSFGHPVAKKYSISSGRKKDIKDQDLGFCLTHEAMEELNNLILNRLLANKVNAFPVQPSSIFQVDNQQIHGCNDSIIGSLVKDNFVPVLYGDAVLDATRGFTILSGDAIISYISGMKEITLKRIIYLMDVDGVYDKNPKMNDDAKLFKSIFIKDEEVLVEKGGVFSPLKEEIQTEDEAIDVTGGIFNKINELVKLNNKGIEIYLINGQKENGITDLIKGKLDNYTKILYIE
ncbi:MAG: isopentenyl phosphate kinase [Candidatus Hodarchaeota archaeon]